MHARDLNPEILLVIGLIIINESENILATFFL